MTNRIADRLRVSFDGQGCEIVKEPEYRDEPVELTLHEIVRNAVRSVISNVHTQLGPADSDEEVIKIALTALKAELEQHPQTQPIAEAIHDALGSSDNSTEINCALTIKDASLYLHMQPTPSPGEIEPWMTEDYCPQDAREYMLGKIPLDEIFEWALSRKGHEYWSARDGVSYKDLSPEDQAYIRLIASADGQPLPEVE